MRMEQDAEGRAPEDAFDGDSEGGGWYFDLPNGAWERQEAKSRELRQSVRTNAEDDPEPERNDPFAANRRSFFGRGKKNDEPAPEGGRQIAGGKWVLNRDPNAFKESPEPEAEAATGDHDWSAEPLLPAARADWEAPRAEDDAPPADGKLRWSDAFAGADDDSDPLRPMRDWARRRDDAPEPATELPEQVTELPADLSDDIVEPEEFVEAVAESPTSDWVPEVPEPASTVLPLLRHGADDDEAGTEPEPSEATSRWDEVFASAPVESNMLDAMRNWAQGEMDTGAHEPDDAPRDIPAEFLQPFDWETEDDAGSPPPVEAVDTVDGEVEAEPAEAVLAEEAIDITLSDPDALVDPLGASEDDDASLAAVDFDDEVTSLVEEPAGEVSWADLPDPGSIEPVQLGQPEAQKKRGFFGRLFGRKKKSEPEFESTMADLGGDWIPAEDEAEVRTTSDDALADDDADWLPAAAVVEDSDALPASEPVVTLDTEAESADDEADVMPEPVANWSDWTPVGVPGDEPGPDGYDEGASATPAIALDEKPEASAIAASGEDHDPAFAEPSFAEDPDDPIGGAGEPLPTLSTASAFDSGDGDPEPEATGGEFATPLASLEAEAEADAEGDEPLAAGDEGATIDLPAEVTSEWEWEAMDAQPESESDPAFAVAPDSEQDEAGGTDDDYSSEFAAFDDIFQPAATIEAEDAESAPPGDPDEANVEQAPEVPWAVPESSLVNEELDSTESIASNGEVDDDRRQDDFEQSDDDSAAARLIQFPAAEEAPPVSEPEDIPENVVALRPAQDADDDPWAAFIASRRASGEPFPKGDVPAEQNPAGWDDLFSREAPEPQDASVDEHAPASEPEPEASTWAHVFGQLEAPSAAPDDTSDLTPLPRDEEAAAGPEAPASDDPWAAVAEASGYGGEPSDVAVYRGHWAAGDDRPTRFARDEFAGTGDEPDTGTSISDEPLWAPEQPGEEDVVLRAFYAHASADDSESEDREPLPDQDHPFEPLLGKHAEELIDEAAGELEPRSFIRPEAWAPQRARDEEDAGWTAPEDDGVSGWDGGFGNDDYPPYATGFEPDPEPVSAPAAHRARTVVREVVETVLLAVLVFLCVRASFQNFKVSGESMYPTLDNGQFVIVNKLVYSEVDTEKLSKFVPFIEPGDQPQKHIFHGPERGDIIVLQDPRPDHNEDLIKRVIALPGERIRIQGGQVYINGYLLKEPYITEPWNDNMPEILLGQQEYFVMGDNRKNSLDSRSGTVGLIHEDLIIGKAMFSYWPTSHFGLAPNGNPELQKPELTAQRLED